MARRKDPAAAAIEFFQNAPLEAAQTVLGIAKNVVAGRQPKTRRSSKDSSVAPPPGGDLAPAQAAGFMRQTS